MPRNPAICANPPGSRRRVIVERLRAAIVSGKLAPGARLPTREELGRRFAAGSDAVQYALNQLAMDGFIYARQKVGTFVSESSPHLCQYAVVYPQSLDPQGGPTFARALSQVAVNPDPQGRRRTKMYFGVERHADSEDFLHLVADVQARRMAGMIFAGPPFFLADTPVLETPGIPRVAFMGASRPGIDAITVDGSFFAKACDHLRAQGRRRAACLLLATAHSSCLAMEKQFLSAASKHGLLTHPYWIQPATSVGAARCVHLLMSAPEADRPDALIVADDTMVESATCGLLMAGMHPPKDLDVVAHCNYPCPPRAVTPVRLLGYDVRQVFQMALEAVDRRRQGLSVPPLQTVPPLFEDELTS